MILDFKALFKLCFQINLGFLTVIFLNVPVNASFVYFPFFLYKGNLLRFAVSH